MHNYFFIYILISLDLVRVVFVVVEVGFEYCNLGLSVLGRKKKMELYLFRTTMASFVTNDFKRRIKFKGGRRFDKMCSLLIIK